MNASLEVLNDETQWPIKLLTDRWGEPMEEKPEPVDKVAIDSLVPHLFDELSFVAKHPEWGYGLLIETEHECAGCEDSDEEIRLVWNDPPDAPLRTREQAFQWLLEHCIQPLRKRWPDLMVWATVGPHIFNSRMALEIFIPLGSPLLNESQEIGKALARGQFPA